MDETRLGCRVSELEIGMEFSFDEGRNWWVVRTEPKYVDYNSREEFRLTFQIEPWDSCKLSNWETFTRDEREHVLLERTWKGY